MNTHDYQTLFSALDEAIAILEHNRTPEPEFIAAFDTLKQSRAMVAKTLAESKSLHGVAAAQMAA